MGRSKAMRGVLGLGFTLVGGVATLPNAAGAQGAAAAPIDSGIIIKYDGGIIAIDAGAGNDAGASDGGTIKYDGGIIKFDGGILVDAGTDGSVPADDGGGTLDDGGATIDDGGATIDDGGTTVDDGGTTTTDDAGATVSDDAGSADAAADAASDSDAGYTPPIAKKSGGCSATGAFGGGSPNAAVFTSLALLGLVFQRSRRRSV